MSLLIFWLLFDVCLLLLHVSFIFDCLVYFFHYSVLRVRFYNKIKLLWGTADLAEAARPARGAVLEVADVARVGVGRAEPEFDAGPMHVADRAAALAGRQQRLADAGLVADPTDRHATTSDDRLTRSRSGGYRIYKRGGQGRGAATRRGVGSSPLDPRHFASPSPENCFDFGSQIGDFRYILGTIFIVHIIQQTRGAECT